MSNEEKRFTYYDSVAGKQDVVFKTLSEIISYLEKYEPEGDSSGTVYQNDKPIIDYVSENVSLSWQATNIE